ncbi:MAG: beta-lactamase family protein [Polyangiaceae bacterium]|nr:beta-lactamase family protein [Polyangiaceae bacterium]
MNRYSSIALVLGFGSLVWACSDDEPAGTDGTGAGPAATTTTGAGGAPTTATTGSGGGGGDTWDPRFDAFVEALQQDLAENDAYGVSVAIMENGQVTFAHAFGSKDKDGLEPLTPTTLMQIGSTTKQMTATSLLRKVEAGDLALDDTLEEKLPMLEFALDSTWDDQLTPHLLLSHQGGIIDYIDWGGPANDANLANFMYGPFADQLWLMSPPGAFWNYSNPNFVFAGLLNEELDTRAWPDIIREDVYVPLGMTRTFARKAEVEADGDYSGSFGFTVDALENGGPASDVPMSEIGDSASVRPAGLVWTTPTQMMDWAKFLIHGNTTVLSDELRSEITTAHVSTLYLNGAMQYGYGVDVWEGFLTSDGDEFYPTPVWEHGGNTISMTNAFWVLPEKDFAICITTNGYATNFDHSVDVAIKTLVDLPAPIDPPMYTVDPTQFSRHVGTYYDLHNVGEVTIEDNGGNLTISMPDLEAAGVNYDPELTAISSDIFVLHVDGQNLDLTFVPTTPGGSSVYIRNRAFVISRPEPAFAPQAAPSAHPDRASILRMLARARMEDAVPRRVLNAAKRAH